MAKLITRLIIKLMAKFIAYYLTIKIIILCYLIILDLNYNSDLLFLTCEIITKLLYLKTLNILIIYLFYLLLLALYFYFIFIF